MNTKNNFMLRAIELSINSANNDGGPFGCVITKENEIIAEGSNKVTLSNDPTAHAEINAIREACVRLNTDRLNGCDIYVTLEPCIMCAAAISRAKIKRLYYGADDLIYGSVNGNINFFQSKNCNHVPEIYDNISKIECESLINNFFKGKR